MAAFDPYSPCPCGSGEKFKWCCQKVEAYADRAHRLFQNGQGEAAIAAIDEGLRKEPGNSWLLSRKAIYLISQGENEAAKETLRRLIDRNPEHVGGLLLLTRLILETEGAVEGATALQRVFTAVPAERWEGFGHMVCAVGAELAEAGYFAAGRKHAEQGKALDPESATEAEMIERAINLNPEVSPWQKNSYRLSPPPSEFPEPARERFEQALHWAEEGLWSSAASAFEVLSADRVAPVESDRNAGLCRLWMADQAGAVDALRRSIARAGATTESVDLETLCQEIAPTRSDDLVELVQWIWPLRNRDALLAALRADQTVYESGTRPIDVTASESPVVESFDLLDRPPIPDKDGLRIEELPAVLAQVLVGQEIVALEGYDDGRLEGLADRLTALAGQAIPPAHPKTKVLAKDPRAELALTVNWLPPEGLSEARYQELKVQQTAFLVRELWPNTPMPYLGGRTPKQAAEAGGFEVPLRAAVFSIETRNARHRSRLGIDALRDTLKIGHEPSIDPATVDIASLHLSRLTLVPIEALDDDRLAQLYRRARESAIGEAVSRAARVLIDRPDAWERLGISCFQLYADLAAVAVERDQKDEALDWVRRGRQAEPAALRAGSAVAWDMFELRLRARLEAPEVWVPELAIVLERYRSDPQASETILLNLVEMGLIQMVPREDDPSTMALDTRRLQAVLARYGPRVTTASGQLGIAATKGELWTPGASRSGGGGGGGLWTPGSGQAGEGGEPSKLIIPGH